MAYVLASRDSAAVAVRVGGKDDVTATNVVWTNHGACAVDGFEETRLRLRATGQTVTVYGVDKFPRMVDYVMPSGVRIADADRVRLGAHLASGTTVMHEGFVNFNAGTLGASMVEGRISAGVVVGDGSDIGGGASIMGTLSGGGKEVISVGERCLIGANAGIGVSLGDDCVVEAGCYVTAGTKVTVLEPGADAKVVKALELSGAKEDDRECEHQDRANDPILDQRECQDFLVAEHISQFLILYLGKGGIHHDDKADGNRDIGGADLKGVDELFDAARAGLKPPTTKAFDPTAPARAFDTRGVNPMLLASPADGR